MERGKAGTGAVLSLDAIGAQDKYLLGDESFFTYKPREHTKFSTYFNRYEKLQPGDIQSWPFGRKITFTLNPKTSGDLLAGMYLKFTLPAIVQNPDDPEPLPIDDIFYSKNVGYAVIKEIRFEVEGDVIERLTTDYLVLHKELYTTDSEENAINNLVNNANTAIEPVFEADYPLQCYVPIPFFFTRKRREGIEKDYRPYFFLSACYNQEVRVVVEFNPVTFFTGQLVNKSPSGDPIPQGLFDLITVDKVELVTEEILLSPEERYHYLTTRQISVIDISGKNPTTTYVKNPVITPNNPFGSYGPQSVQTDASTTTQYFKTQLINSNMIKAMHWFFRNIDFTEINNTTFTPGFVNRFNFSNNLIKIDTTLDDITFFPENLYPVMSEASIEINGANMLSFTGASSVRRDWRGFGSDYYKYVETYKNGFRTPEKNIYTYSFSLEPSLAVPSGALNFGALDSQKTRIEGTLLQGVAANTYTMDVYYIETRFLQYQDGFCGLVFST